VLTGSWSLSAELRVPAISRLQKVHNVSVVLGELARRGVVPDWKGRFSAVTFIMSKSWSLFVVHFMLTCCSLFFVAYFFKF